MIIAIALGAGMLTIAWSGLQTSQWIWIKIVLVALLVIFHFSCGRMIKAFAEDRQLRTERFFRVYNELPVLVLVPVVILAVVKPF
jgi:putative membrane protein